MLDVVAVKTVILIAACHFLLSSESFNGNQRNSNLYLTVFNALDIPF